MLLQHGRHILLCGGAGADEECLKLEKEKWSSYNTLNNVRLVANAIQDESKSFIFGGQTYPMTSEILKHDSTEWLIGPEIPNPGLEGNCGVQISSNEFLIIGGYNAEKQILKFTTDDKKWHNTSLELKVGRYYHKCMAFNGNIIIAGGNYHNGTNVGSTEIIDIATLKIREGKNLNIKRRYPGMGIITINDIPTLVIFGGELGFKNNTDTVEVWNENTESWIMSDEKLQTEKSKFGFISVPIELLCPN